MRSSLTQQESAAISYLRVVAMGSIVFCHFLQALESNNLIFIFFYIVFYTLLLSVASETIVRLFTKI